MRSRKRTMLQHLWTSSIKTICALLLLLGVLMLVVCLWLAYLYRNGTNMTMKDTIPSSTKICSQLQRLQAVNRTCDQVGNMLQNGNITSAFHNLIVAEQHKLLICVTPYTGSNTIRNMLYYSVTGKQLSIEYSQNEIDQAMGRVGLVRLSDMPTSKQVKVLQEYYKILTVRHPLDRLLSCWETDFLKTGRYVKLRSHAKEAIKEFRKLENNYDYEEILKGATLEEFLQYVYMVEKKQNGKHEEQWNTYNNLCQPCAINYDMVLKLETWSADSKLLLRRLKVTQHQRAPQLDREDIHSEISLILKPYKDIPYSIVQQMINVYGVDMDMFGYTLDPKSLEATWINNKTGFC